MTSRIVSIQRFATAFKSLLGQHCPLRQHKEGPLKKLKVLFFAEGATLAHVARPFILAKGLDPDRFDVTLCRPASFSWLTDGLPFRVEDLDCQNASVFARRLARGLPLYDLETLSDYVGADLSLIDREQPDVVIGDFRLSLSVSARLRAIPYITICDAYWSPEVPLTPPLPVMSFTRFAPIGIAENIFRLISPLAFRLHALPMERLRARFGLATLGYDLRRCYTDADLRLFANFPALFPKVRPHAGADFVGPIAWSPETHENLDFLSGDQPLVYITMGSSGDLRIPAQIIPVFEELGYRIVVTTAGRALPSKPQSPSTQVFDFLPGAAVCQRASLVVCNGGSPTTNQALRCGVPVLGIAQNMDQFLNMRAVEAYGAGLLLRSDRTNSSNLLKSIKTMVTNPRFTERARTLAQSFPDESPHLVTFIDQLLGHHPAMTQIDATTLPPAGVENVL